MFDANLCHVPSGSIVMIGFHGKPVKGDKCQIKKGHYECEIIDNDLKNGSNNMVIDVFYNGKNIIINHGDIGNRIVTYEGHINNDY
tara:strand:- start:969 stop:1226 length:258 start_codon:yes stop_codon:yes gene_type:complete